MGKSTFLILLISVTVLLLLLILPYSVLFLSSLYYFAGVPARQAFIFGAVTWAIILLFDVYVLSGFKIVKEWERAPILRLGRYIGMLGPGFIHIWRGFESYQTIIDLRINALQATSERTMTKDNVPVDVDAIVYWKVINPEKAILNVTDYDGMVSYVSQTSLREIIGEHELDVLIAEREKMGRRLREIIDSKTEERGRTSNIG